MLSLKLTHPCIRNNFVAEFDSSRTKEVADFCLRWAKQIEKQQWQVEGKPAPGVTAKMRYFDTESTSLFLPNQFRENQILDNQNLDSSPVVHFDPDYCLKGNRTGLLSLFCHSGEDKMRKKA